MPEGEATEAQLTPGSIRKRIEARVKGSPITSPAVQAFVDFATEMFFETTESEKESLRLEKSIVKERVVERMTSVVGYQEEYRRVSEEFWELANAHLIAAKISMEKSQDRASGDLLTLRDDLLYPNRPEK